jgi:hypothetical protein
MGRLLRNVRGHDQYLACNDRACVDASESIELSSPAFRDGGHIPIKFAGKGEGLNVSPPLLIGQVPEDAAELVLIMQDPDAPVPRPIVHLLAVGIAPTRNEIPEGMLLPDASSEIQLGRGSLGQLGYFGPRPVPGHGPHRYVFQIFALDTKLSLARKPRVKAVLAAMQGLVIAKGRLTGKYEVR